MSNIAGKAYAMNVVTPSNPKITWLNRLIFMAARGLPKQLGGLLGLSLIHFARWVLIKRDEWPDLGQGKQSLDNDYMIFCSNFNGTWDQYIDAFSDGIPSGLNLFWFTATKYPKSIPVTPFKDYITFNQIYTDYYYNATPGSAQRDIKCTMRVYDALLDLEQQYSQQTPEEFAQSYRKALLKVQGCLGDPGYGPVASLDTENADINREPFVKHAEKELFATVNPASKA
jgi:hypothetical protein